MIMIQFFLEQYLYSTLLEKCFKTDFDHGPQLENAWKLKCMFSISGTSRGRKSFLKHFSNKVLYIYCSKKNWSVSVSIWKIQKMDFPLYFKNVILKLPKVFKEIDHGCFRVFGPYFIGKSPCVTCRLTFEFWSIIVCPYLPVHTQIIAKK